MRECESASICRTYGGTCLSILKSFKVNCWRRRPVLVNRRSEEEQEDFLDAAENEIICDEAYCPFIREFASPSNPTCEGRYCDLAWDNYCLAHDKVYVR